MTDQTTTSDTPAGDDGEADETHSAEKPGVISRLLGFVPNRPKDTAKTAAQRAEQTIQELYGTTYRAIIRRGDADDR